MKRYLTSHILDDLDTKIVLVSGPRQCGKTTLAKQLCTAYDYFNYDSPHDRIDLQHQRWDRSKPLIIFDELHKMSGWKRWLKGIYDTQGIPPSMIVTGSAKMNAYRKVGDSLAGRYFHYRLHPIDLHEASQFLPDLSAQTVFERLLTCGGFPEPFLNGKQTFYQRWRRSHLDIILRQDMLDLQTIRDIQAMETLVALLKSRVGGCISYANLARDLERDAKTIKRWLGLLCDLFIIFPVTPYHHHIARSLLKEPKFYFYDGGQVESDEGNRLENLVACHLLKAIHYLEDTTGQYAKLHYLRTKDGQELDFLITIEHQPVLMIEVKSSQAQPSKAFAHFRNQLPQAKAIQLVWHLSREQTYPDGLAIRSLIDWLQQGALLQIA